MIVGMKIIMSIMRYFAWGKMNRTNSPVRFIWVCIILVVTALPLFMLPFTYSVFDLPKAMLLIVLASLIWCTLAFKITREGRLTWNRTSLDIPMTFLLVILTISTIFSINPITSLTGSSLSDRNESFLIFLSYLLLAMVTKQFIAGELKQIQYLLRILVITASAISIYAIFQYFGIDYFHYAVSGIDVKRPPGTLGQPSYLGAYLALALPIALVISSTSTRRLNRIIYALSSTMIGIALILTYTRGAWLGAIAAVFIIALYAVLRRGQYRTKLLVHIACILPIILLAVVLSGSPDIINERVSSALGLKGSIVQRLGIWDSTLSLIKERSLIGWGIETFEDIHPRVETLSLVKLEGGPIRADRPHNQILYIVYSMGIIGLLAYLWLLITVFLTGFRSLKSLDGKESFLLIGILGALLGCIISEQFLFSVAAVTPIFWILVGLPVSSRDHIRAISIGRFKASVLRYAMVIIAAISLAMAAAFIAADVLYERGDEALYENDFVSAFDYYESATKINPWQVSYMVAMAKTADLLSRQDSNFSWSNTSISYLERATGRNPNNRDIYMALGNLYFSQSVSESGDNYKKSASAYRKALKVSPLFIPAHIQLARTLLLQKNPDEALYHLDLATSLQLNNETAHSLTLEAQEQLRNKGVRVRSQDTYRQLRAKDVLEAR